MGILDPPAILGVLKCEANGCDAILPRNEVRKKEDTFDPDEHYVCHDVPAGWLVSWVEKGVLAKGVLGERRGRLVVLCPMHGAGKA